MKKEVVIVGAGPAGLATAACLNKLNIPNIVLEKEDCYAHLWKKKTYDRLELHLAKEFCALPHMPHPNSAPTYIARNDFIGYMDEYVAKFGVSPVCNTVVKSAYYDKDEESWIMKVEDTVTGEENEYVARFLVVATGENAEGFVPNIPGLGRFGGDVMHSSQYKSGKGFAGRSVLVVGCGNSGMEIAHDLSNFGAKTSIVVKSPFHVMTKEIIHFAMTLAIYLPIKLVDTLLVILSSFHFGNLSKYGIVRPAMGPLTVKGETGRAAVLDVGTVGKIKKGEIQVVKEIIKVNHNEVEFKDGKREYYDVIIFATGYRSTAKTWLMDNGWLFNEQGYPKQRFPNHWKGKNGLYCAGFARTGLAGISVDAQNIAKDIDEHYDRKKILWDHSDKAAEYLQS